MKPRLPGKSPRAGARSDSAAPPAGGASLRLSPAQTRRLVQRLRRGVRELDAALSLAGGATDNATGLEWTLDPEPLLLDSTTWELIEGAVRQRARLVNALLVDLYGAQEVLRQRLVPADLVFGDPFFRRPCVGLEPGRASPATVLRFDLMQTATAGWVFVDAFANTPIGAGFAVQNRRFLAQERGEYFAALPEFRTVTDFPVRLLEHLERLSPRQTDNPNAVVLTAGPADPNFFEHSFLARKMGLPLAQGGDLLVLEDRVYFRTVGGLVPVDVVYRRVNDAHVDPVALPTDRLTGVPGLIASIRARRVAVANAIGAGVADNRALEAYLPRLMRFFLGERPILPGVTTYDCGDPDQLAVALDAGNSFALVPAQAAQVELPSALPGAPGRLRRRVLARLRADPHRYVARQLPEPAVSKTKEGRREIRLSCYALCEGRHVTVMPGGLVRLLPAARPLDPPGWQVGATADLVVLAADPDVPGEEPAGPPDRVRPWLLGSRVADHLYWAGRYAERAEGTARILSLIEDVALEEISQQERRAWFPIWRGVLEATGHAGVARATESAWFTAGLAWHMALDGTNASSLLASVRAARDNALQCREIFSPETWGVISRVGEKLGQLAARGANRRAPARRALAAEAVGVALDGLAAFFGTVDRTMLHDTGWQFFQIGMHLERAIMTCSGLRHALAEAERAERGHRRARADFGALVRMLSSQDAYRRTYQARIEPLFVAELFLRNRAAPKSITACLLAVRDGLAAISGSIDEPRGEATPLVATQALLARLDALDLRHFFAQQTDSPRFDEPAGQPARPAAVAPDDLAAWLAELSRELGELGVGLHDFYVSHQARFAPPRPARRN